MVGMHYGLEPLVKAHCSSLCNEIRISLSLDLVVIEYLITIILKFSSTIITKNRVYT